MDIDIDVPTITKTIELKKGKISVRQIYLFNYAVIDVRLLDANGIQWDLKTFQISGEDY